ncbi:dehydration-responsive element-binding protein 3-like protein [Corchorus capsularis]|uniref:Dehydration-responsive element-binding protein 3-like protein n=1 Tax=Corchorus capsularis TaxID=210143 RepID=A0A1R3IJB6_COCAP|nr:dehydration-responsive element-binding protein 3-like protein [Corchorus capsularis]
MEFLSSSTSNSNSNNSTAATSSSSSASTSSSSNVDDVSTPEELSEIVELPSLGTSYESAESGSEFVYVDPADGWLFNPGGTPWYFEENCGYFGEESVITTGFGRGVCRKSHGDERKKWRGRRATAGGSVALGVESVFFRYGEEQSKYVALEDFENNQEELPKYPLGSIQDIITPATANTTSHGGGLVVVVQTPEFTQILANLL